MSAYVLGYFPGWNRNLPPDQIDFSLFTHIAHAFAPITPDGKVAELTGAKALCRKARESRSKVLLSVGGADSNTLLTGILGDPARYATLLDSLLRRVDEDGYAGVDVDWEALTSPEDRDRLSELVVRLRERLGKERLLTMAVPASDWAGKWFEVSVLLPNTDFINVMTYDFHGPWSERSGHNANLLPYPGDDGMSFVSAYQYWTRTKQWPQEKLLFGIPCYGRGFRVRKWGDAPDKTAKAPREYAGWETVEALRKLDWKREWDAVARVPLLISPRRDEFISYEDAESAREKGHWCRQQKLAGIFFWEISQDYAGGAHNIVRGARRGFLG